jgi:hypothetical protein
VPTWKTESLRVTAFRLSAEPVSVDSLWRDVVGSPPERIDHRPKEGVINATASYEGATLTLSATSQRTDWVWVVQDVMHPPSQTEYPSIGEFGKVEKVFIDLATKWINQNSAISRVAWGGTLLLPVPSKEEGYETLNRFLPNMKLDPVGSADLLYRINRPRQSKVVDGLRINRLSNWAVAFTKYVAFQLVAGPAGQTPAASMPGPELHACRMQFDINSDATRQEPLPDRSLASLLEEMIELSREIAARGDVP